jgi:uncharacterized protein (TIGR03790 family)
LPRFLAALALALINSVSAAEGFGPEQLGVLYNLDDHTSEDVARYYAARRSIPKENLVGVHLGGANVVSPEVFAPIRKQAIDQLPTAVQSMALVWSRPFAVGCMSVTSAFAAGYRADFCEPGCGATAPNPLFDETDWLPADTVGWWPAMLLPSADPALARALIERGIAADREAAGGVVYLIRTSDVARNVRAETYGNLPAVLGRGVKSVQLTAPIVRDVHAAIGYFTGAARVEELPRIQFLPGAVADHLTSTAGILYGGNQMSALAWLTQGATATYGSVSEPCNRLEKFPNVEVLMRHYLRGESIIEAYWKSVAMPGQGLFIGEPLARPYATRRQ